MTIANRIIRLAEGDWVQDAKDSGWWDNLAMLKGYVEDMEFDYEEAIKPPYPSPYAQELKDDIETVKQRIAELEGRK